MSEINLKIISHTMMEFSNRLKVILEDNLVSVILFGSAVLCDFTPGKGDLDFVVVVRNDLSNDDCNKLFELHDLMRTGKKGVLAKQLEGTYYPINIIKNPKTSKAFGCYVGTSRKGWKRIDSNCNSLIDYLIIREYGMTCYGEDITPLFFNPSRKELLEEIRNGFDLNIEMASKIKDPDYAASMFTWGPRALCYAMTGKILSKSSASEWYTSEFPDTEWTPLVTYSKKLRYPLTSNEIALLDPSIKSNVKKFLLHLQEIYYVNLPRDTAIASP